MGDQFYVYLAGFIDADGCFQLIRKMNPHVKRGFSWFPTLTIVQAGFPPKFLQSLEDEIGFGYIYKLRHPIYALAFTSGYLRRLLPKILPYLRKKKNQAKLLWEAVQLLKHRGTGHHYDEDDRLNEIAYEIKMLKPKNKFRKK